VPGHPAPQGSKQPRPIYKGRGEAKKFTGRVALEESSKAVQPWRTDVRKAFEQNWHMAKITGPVRLQVVFVYDRPKTHYRTGRNAHLLREGAPEFPASKNRNDIDKLLRSTKDAITSVGRVWVDDAFVVATAQVKVYSDHPAAERLGGRGGAIIQLMPVHHTTEIPEGDIGTTDNLLAEIGF
jgi:crossover junction endodeoxyribonuclease RusA